MRCVVLAFYCLASLTSSSTTAFLSPTFPAFPQCTSRRGGSELSAKKGAAKKIQVKLNTNVKGTGQKGDVIQVTPAFFNNKLRPTQAADIISDDEVAQEETERKQAYDEERQEAQALAEELAGTIISIRKKAGPEGNLFGGIGPKVIMDELQAVFKEHIDFLSRKGVKIVAVTDENGKKMRQDIKHTGEFGAQIALTKEISGKVKIEVKAE